MATSKKQVAADSGPKVGRGRRSTDPRVIVASGIKTSERDELLAIAESYGLSLNAVTTYFLRYAMEHHRQKKFKIPTITKSVSFIKE